MQKTDWVTGGQHGPGPDRGIFFSDLSYSHKRHLKICFGHIADVTDKAGYAADYLEVVALKAMI